MPRPFASLAFALASALAACTSPTAPTGPTPTPPPAASTTTSLPTGTTTASGRPLSLEQITRDDPTLPVHLQWPVVEGAKALNANLSDWSSQRERSFLAENRPSTEAPPEVSGTWSFVLDAADLVGVRQTLYEFAGASGATTSRVVYADLHADRAWTSAELVRGDARRAAAEAIVVAARASGRVPFSEQLESDVVDSLLSDLTFAGGELVPGSAKAS